MDAGQYSLVYNGLSFTFASMAASTMFFWLRLGSIHEQHKTVGWAAGWPGAMSSPQQAVRVCCYCLLLR